MGNGSVLLLGASPSSDKLDLNWTVTSRSGSTVSLSVGVHNTGCLLSKSQWAEAEKNRECTQFDYYNATSIQVNLTQGELFSGDQTFGLLDFWEPPLLNSGQIYAGTIFVNGQRFDSIANVSGPEQANFGRAPINMSGTPVSGPYYSYSVEPTLFAQGLSYQTAWLDVQSGVVQIGNRTLTSSPIGPTGVFDYYNGLAYSFSPPSYPINETVCAYRSGEAIDCQVAVYSTTLGQLLRSGNGYLYLTATNIALEPNQISTNPSPLTLPLTVAAFASAVIAFGTAITVVYALRKRHRRPRTRR